MGGAQKKTMPPKEKEKSNEEYFCSICSRDFKTLPGIQRHERFHAEGYQFKQRQNDRPDSDKKNFIWRPTEIKKLTEICQAHPSHQVGGDRHSRIINVYLNWVQETGLGRVRTPKGILRKIQRLEGKEAAYERKLQKAP